MCDPVSAVVGGVSAIAGIGGAALQRKQQSKEQAYNDEVTRLQTQYKADVEKYQDTQYGKDLDYFNSIVAYQSSEMDRQMDFLTKAKTDITTGLGIQLKTLATQELQNAIATTMQMEGTRTQGRQARGQATNSFADRGISANSNGVKLALGDLYAQEGKAVSTERSNNGMVQRQLQLEGLGFKSQANSQLNQLQVKTFQPIEPPAPPPPVSPVNPSAPVARTSMFASVINSVTQGVSSAASLASSGMFA